MQTPMRIRFTVVLVVFSALLNSQDKTCAQTSINYYWTAGTGNWSVPGNWYNQLTVGVPGGSNHAIIDNGGTAVIGTGDSATAFRTFVGLYGTGSVSQSGGSNSVGYWLSLAENSGSVGTYQLRGGTLSAVLIDVGKYGTGTFSHTDGTAAVSTRVYVGGGTGSYGEYQISSSAILNTENLYMGGTGGTGRFFQNGGSVNINNELLMGLHLGGSATYELQNGILISGSLSIGGCETFPIGSSGTGEFLQTGGTARFTNDVWLGYFDSAAEGPTISNQARRSRSVVLCMSVGPPG